MVLLEHDNIMCHSGDSRRALLCDRYIVVLYDRRFVIGPLSEVTFVF